MKKIKLNLMALIGMLVAIGTVAFTAPKSVSKDVLPMHFEFIGDAASAAQYKDANNWQSSTGTINCEGDALVCEVKIDDTSITTPQELADALSNMSNPAAVNYISDKTLTSRD